MEPVDMFYKLGICFYDSIKMGDLMKEIKVEDLHDIHGGVLTLITASVITVSVLAGVYLATYLISSIVSAFEGKAPPDPNAQQVGSLASAAGALATIIK